MAVTTAYGSWKSPITSDLIISEVVTLREVRVDGDDLYWIESRPQEGGRYVIVRYGPAGAVGDVNPAPLNARTRVHEYGGGAYLVADGVAYYSNFADQRLYRQQPGAAPQPLTPANALRYADAIIDRDRQRLLAVVEDHSHDEREAINSIGAISLATGEVQTLVAGNDFYSSPRLSPDGARLAWLTWHHPNMPWDGTELWVAEVRPDGSLGQQQQVAGGLTESIFQPEWSPDGSLYFISDRTSGWWNLYRWHNGDTEALTELAAEFGLPQWVFGESTYGFQSAEQIICTYTQHGRWYLARLDTTTRHLEPIDLPYDKIDEVRVRPDFAVFKAGSPTLAAAIVRLDLNTGRHESLRRSSQVEVDEGYLSRPQSIEFPTAAGLTAYAFYYKPQNKDFAAPAGEKPPLLVFSHGGPTGSTSTTFSLSIQYWTSRGFAVADVNYGGSTGYGRAYRDRLKGQWGVVDLDDCANVARYLVEQGQVDPQRLAIRGGSAGGYTTLAVLTFRDVFKAGASYYGISDLAALALETHKFESRYLDQLVGPYPQAKAIYEARSPIHHVDQLARPIIFFQGLEDKVVLPNQAEMLVDALRQKGVPVAYLPFPGEQHGFRRAENIKRSLDAELYFYSSMFDFALAEPVEPVQIENF